MNAFEIALKIAIEEYAKLEGRSFEEIATEAKDTNSQTFKNVLLFVMLGKAA